MNDLYHIVGAPATREGRDGVQLWISKTLPIYEGGPLIQQKDITIVEANPTALIVKLRTLHWRCLLITGRAPHSGHGLLNAEHYWHNISVKIRQLSRTWPTFFLGDTNGHLGAVTTEAIGDHHPRQENDSGTAFHQWLLEHHLFAPATFGQHHQGDTHCTFVSPDGDHSTRIDYVAVPNQLHYEELCTWVATDIDTLTQRVDHVPVLCHLTVKQFFGDAKPARRLGRPSQFGLGDTFGQTFQDPAMLHALHDAIQMPPWCTDPHATADTLAAQTQQAVQHLLPKVRRWPRKTHISDETWQIVQHKKSLFKQLKALKKTKATTILQAVFQAWQGRDPSARLQGWLPLSDHAIAITMRSLRKTSTAVTEAIRREDGHYYSALAQQAAHTYTVEGLTALWKCIKAVLPKNRICRSIQRFDLGDEMLQHFEQLEAGTTRPTLQNRQRCLSRNHANLHRQPDVLTIDLEELPTLAETEDLCLRQRPNKAPGPDGLSSNACRYGAVALSPHLHGVMLKAFLSAIEPYRYKGGYLVPIWKQKGPQTQADSYRGILLSDSFGKIYHAWMRRRLLPTMLQRRALGQLGGLPSQQTVSGIQMLRLHGRLGRIRKVSTAVIFVDLRSAFHHLLREFVFNDDLPLQYDELKRILDPMDFDLEALAAELQQATETRPADMPPALRRCLADTHQSTWFQLDPEQASATETRRGTRPGSPLADIGFNLLMSEIVNHLREFLDGCTLQCKGHSAIGIATPPVTWVDDLAVPLASERPDDLLPLVQEVTTAMHALFRRYGLTLNMQRGKTEVVMMYRGRDSNRFRTLLFDTSTTPTIVTSTPSHVVSIRVVPSYRHLGARYTMDLDINEEIESRISMAKQAFEELRKAIFGNRAMSSDARTKLYDSLVLSRLLYGCSTWSDVPAPHLKRIETMIMQHHRRIHNLGFWTASNVSDQEFAAIHQVMPFRIHWARHRLVYLQHISRHALPVHRALLLAEYVTGKGWLREVVHDLRWLQQLVQMPFDVPTQAEQWETFWPQLASWQSWKRQVQRACRKHLIQEKLAWEVASYHRSIVTELTLVGAEVTTNEIAADPSDGPTFRCAQCPQSFPTQQQLSLHAFRLHGVVAQERYYAQSTVCPGCLRDFHTTYRVTQHLRYRRNGCWDRVHLARAPDNPITIGLPDHLIKIKRLPAIRRHHGPLRPTSVQRTRIRLRQEIARLRAEGHEECAWWFPSDDEPLVHQANQVLCDALHAWCAMDAPSEVDFHNAMFGALFTLDCSDPQRCRLFIHWVEAHLHDVCPPELDPDIAILLEQAYMSVLDDLPTWHVRQRMKALTAQWMHLPPDYPDYDAPEPPAVARPYNRMHSIDSAYHTMAIEEQQRCQWKFLRHPVQRPLATIGPYFIVHLYSGRRRESDFQHWMQFYLDTDHVALSACAYVISIDTAIHDSMNIHSPALWNKLLDLARGGRLLAMLLEPPCETWSAARNQPLPDEERTGPRPVRTASELWGMPLRSLSELLQLSVGNCLLLKGIWLSVAITCRSGPVVLEHPAMPYDEELPSIWRSGILCLLLRGGRPFRRTTIRQWKFGAEGIKPTMLLYSNGSLPTALEACELSNPVKPTVPLIGRDHTGKFRTARAKEYPAALSRAFALFFSHCLSKHRDQGGPKVADDDLNEFVRLSACLEGGVMMPDYQPV